MKPDTATVYFTYSTNTEVGKFTYLLATKSCYSLQSAAATKQLRLQKSNYWDLSVNYSWISKVKSSKVNVDLYSASTQTPLTRLDMDHTVLPANNTISTFIPQSQDITALWPVLIASNYTIHNVYSETCVDHCQLALQWSNCHTIWFGFLFRPDSKIYYPVHP